jgi:YegS/Rv2252/BmrU family lipid kinase
MAEPGPGPALVILNARSGAGQPQEQARAVEQKLRERGLQVDVTLVHDGDDILAAARKAAKARARMVIAGGGDGTVSAVASCLVNTGVPLGVLPLGTLNHFARDLGIPVELDRAVDVLAQGRVVAVDAGEVNGRVFINNSSLGLYPAIVRDRELQRHHLGRGKWAALAAACVQAARRYPVLALGIDVDGRTYERRSAFVFIGNNEYSMEGFSIGERQRLTGGRLSLYVTQHTGRFGLLRLALLALFGRLRQARDFDMLTAGALVVHTLKKRLHVATDGEICMLETPLRYRILPRALNVIVPAQDEQDEQDRR